MRDAGRCFMGTQSLTVVHVKSVRRRCAERLAQRERIAGSALMPLLAILRDLRASNAKAFASILHAASSAIPQLAHARLSA